jgi:uncharacterized protein YlxW (UPF0749 family)
MKNNAFRSISFTVICIILGVLIALQMKSVNTITLSQKNLDELQTKLLDFAAKNEELSNRNEELQQIINILENDMASGNTQVATIVKEKERAAIFAGLREVTNYGIEIRIRCAEGVDIRDSVLRQFVNELKSYGAQAIAINDERLVAMSEIRATSMGIFINGVSFSRQGEFVIKAITEPKDENYLIKTVLQSIKDSIVNDLNLQSDGYDIQFTPVQSMTLPALSEDSAVFKIDLLRPAE